MIRPKIKIARDSDSKVIQEILQANQMLAEGLDWSRIYPSWILAEWKDEIVGCIQVLVGYPTGMIPLWAVLPKYKNSGIGIYLLWAAEEILRQAGCDGFLGITDSGRILKKLERLGGVKIGQFSLIMKRIYKEERDGQRNKDTNSAAATA